MRYSESFLDYYLLCERHNNVSASVNQNVKKITKDLADSFRTNLAPNLKATFGKLSTDYEYIVAGLLWLSNYAKSKNKKVQFVFSEEVDVKIKKYSTPVKVTVQMAEEAEGIRGFFDGESDPPELSIQLDMYDFEPDAPLYQFKGLIREFQTYLSHELMHCYQYLSKQNYSPTENTLATEKIPHRFSYLVYILKYSEIEAVLMSAYNQYRRLKHEGWSYLTCLLRVLDYTISSEDNTIPNKELTPDYLTWKYMQYDAFDDNFILKYVLACALPKTRFYSLCASDKVYQKYAKGVSVRRTSTIKKYIDKIYDLLIAAYNSKTYQWIRQAFFLVGNTESLKSICRSDRKSMVAYSRIRYKNFDTSDKVYDEEEDTIVAHGRPDNLTEP